LVNLNDITAPRHAPQQRSVDSGVSMSMMRSIQPLGAPATASSAAGAGGAPNNAHKRSNVPSSVPLGQQHPHAFTQQAPFLYNGGGGMGGPPQGGYPMGGGYPQQPYYPQQHQAAPGMQLFGGPMGGGPQPLAIMPPGMGSQGANHYMAGPGPMMHYGGGGAMGGPQMHPQQQAYSGLPASSPSHMTFTQMRQAPSKQNHGAGPIIFDVPAAPSSQQQQQARANGQQRF